MRTVQLCSPLCAITVALAPLGLVTSGCAPTWDSPLLANPTEVARAMSDPATMGQPFDPSAVPKIDPPASLRPCCAFGGDLKAQVGPVPVPLYTLENVIGPKEIGQHGYNKGDFKSENNGLLYTCRGGFIDLAHVRDNIDRTLYLAMEIVRALPEGVSRELWEEGTKRRIRLKPLPKGLLTQEGRWETATTIANYVNYQLSIWHEVITWYGWDSVPGFDERVSAFSPEDLYSNALGGDLAAGIIVDRQMRSRDQFDETVEAWIAEALRRLGVVDKPKAQAAMKAVDGLWWDSKRRVPDMKLVARRDLAIKPPLSPWIVADALGKSASPEIAGMCRGQPPPLKMRVPTTIGGIDLAELVTVEFEFAGWIPEKFPLPAKAGDKVTQADFAAIIEDVRRTGTEVLGEGFDKATSAAP